MTGLDQCEAFYWAEIAPAMQADDRDPDTETPTYRWLNSKYPGFVKHLKRTFDLSPGDFYDQRDIPPDADDESPFAFVAHDPTRTAIEAYLEELLDLRGRAESTVATRRSILRQYLLTYQQVHDTTDLLSPLLDVSEQSAEMDRVADTFDVLRRQDDALTTLASKQKYALDVRQFYQHQVVFGEAEYNPTTALEKRFGWDTTPDWDNPALKESGDKSQVTALFRAADSDQDRFIIIGTCGWGLRPSEVAGLHVSQLPNRDELTFDADPYIEFSEDDRKNGEGTVSLLTGLSLLRDRLDELATREDWNGYLLPSASAEAGHIASETVRRRFTTLADRAGVTVEGETPTPSYGRRFWYTTYVDAIEQVAEQVDVAAEEQGSDDPQVVIQNYLSEEERRRRRRKLMRETLEGLFAE